MKFKAYLGEATGDTVGVMFGRFNPPHRGHKAAWEMASENDHWYVGTNQSTQGKKDPLPYDVKIKAMEALWPEVASHIVPETNLFTLATKVFKEHGKVNLTVYTDEDWLTKTLEKYNGEEGKHGYYQFASIAQKPTPRLSSATDVRNAVIADDREAFERAAGVPADYKIDGKEFFDLVAEYLLPFHTKPAQEDKYNKEDTVKESTMDDLNTLRQLAGLPVEEGAPVEFKPQHEMSDTEKKLADIGRLMMDMAMSQKDDAVSNAMAQLGDRLATGDISSQDDLMSFIKKSKADAAALSNAVTGVIAAYNKGERADPVDDRVKGRKTEYVPPEDDMEEESLDLSSIRDEYGTEESFDPGAEPSHQDELMDIYHQSGEEGLADALGLTPEQLDQEINEIGAEHGLHADDDREEIIYKVIDDTISNADIEEAEIEEAKCSCCGNEITAEGCGCGPDCDHCGGMGKVDEAIEETVDNAYEAAMAELRALAGL